MSTRYRPRSSSGRYTNTGPLPTTRPLATTRKRPRMSELQNTKHFDLPIASVFNVQIAETGTLCTGSTIVNIAQGADETQREGRSCVVKNIQTHTVAKSLRPTGNCAITVRYILVLDKQCNKNVDPVTPDMVVTGLGANNARVDAFYNLDNEERFKILHDSTHVLVSLTNVSQNAGQTANAQYQTHWNTDTDCEIKLDWDTSVSTGAIASITSNNIFLLAIASAPTVVTLETTTRVLYEG